MSTTGCPVISTDGRPWGASQVPWSPFMDEETGRRQGTDWPAGSPGLMCDEFVLGHRLHLLRELGNLIRQGFLGVPTFPPNLSPPALAGTL